MCVYEKGFTRRVTQRNNQNLQKKTERKGTMLSCVWDRFHACVYGKGFTCVYGKGVTRYVAQRNKQNIQKKLTEQKKCYCLYGKGRKVGYG